MYGIFKRALSERIMLLQIPANHLLSASFMSAPAALAISKLFYPETAKSRTTAKEAKEIEKA